MDGPSIDDDSCLSMDEIENPSPPPSMSTLILRFKTVTGMTINIEGISPTETVFDVKKRLERVPNIRVPPIQQRLVFMGRELQDESFIADLPLPTGSVVHLVLRANAPIHVSGSGQVPMSMQHNMTYLQSSRHP